MRIQAGIVSGQKFLAAGVRSDNLQVMKVSELDYALPTRLIAQKGLSERTQSRLLVLDRERDVITHRRFEALTEYLEAGDCLVVNDSRVIPARFFARRQTGGKIEGLFFLILRASLSASR